MVQSFHFPLQNLLDFTHRRSQLQRLKKIYLTFLSAAHLGGTHKKHLGGGKNVFERESNHKRAVELNGAQQNLSYLINLWCE